MRGSSRVSLGEIINGAEAILDGFGRTPPSQSVAQARADVCTGHATGFPCPANYRGGWAVSTEIARVLHAQRQKKLELKLEVERENQLGTCEKCKCFLPLKIWYDDDTIYNHTADTTFQAMKQINPACWQVAIQLQHQK